MKDQLGIVCSSLCVIHCLVTPILLAFGLTGIFASLFSAELFHQIIVFPVALLVLLTVPHIYVRDKGFSLISTGVLGAGLLIAALMFDERYETILSVLGGSLVVTYHIVNLRLQSKFNQSKQQQGAIINIS